MGYVCAPQNYPLLQSSAGSDQELYVFQQQLILALYCWKGFVAVAVLRGEGRTEVLTQKLQLRAEVWTPAMPQETATQQPPRMPRIQSLFHCPKDIVLQNSSSHKDFNNYRFSVKTGRFPIFCYIRSVAP